MTIFHTSLAHLLIDFPRLAKQLSPQGVASTAVSTIFRLLPGVRVSLVLNSDLSGQPLAQSAAGLIIPGEPDFVFANPLAVRGTDFGYLSVEFLQPGTATNLALAVLETLALQFALYAESQRLRQSRQRLQEQHAFLKDALATEKAVIRAAGILAQDRGISLASAEQWIRTEAAHRERTPLSLAEMVIDTLLPNVAELGRAASRPGRPRVVAA